MPTSQELIDEHLQYQEGLPITDARARRKFRLNLQRALSYLWNLRNLPFTTTWAGATVEIVDGRTVIRVNADPQFGFISFGAHSVVVLDGRKLTWIPRGAMENYYQLRGSAFGTPLFYTDPEVHDALTAGYPVSVAIYIYPPLSSAAGHTATISYRWRVPDLVDAALDPGNAANDPLKRGLFPEEWHRSVLYELAVLYEMKDKGNIQALRLQQSIVNENIRNFLATVRHGDSAPQTLVPFNPAGRLYR